MKKAKSRKERSPAQSVGEAQASRLELVVALLGFFIVAIGWAGYLCADGVKLGFELLQSPNSMAAIATEEGLFTDKGMVNFNTIRGIILNLHLFTTVAMLFGSVVLVAFGIRIWKKTRLVYKQ